MGTSCELLINIIPEHATHCEAFAVLLVELALPEGAFASVEAGSSAADSYVIKLITIFPCGYILPLSLIFTCN
jgi:hypothetical protein